MCLATLTNYVILIHSHRQSYTIRKSYTSIDVITQAKLIKIHVLPYISIPRRMMNIIMLFFTQLRGQLNWAIKQKGETLKREETFAYVLY